MVKNGAVENTHVGVCSASQSRFPIPSTTLLNLEFVFILTTEVRKEGLALGGNEEHMVATRRGSLRSTSA